MTDDLNFQPKEKRPVGETDYVWAICVCGHFEHRHYHVGLFMIDSKCKICKCNKFKKMANMNWETYKKFRIEYGMEY